MNLKLKALIFSLLCVMLMNAQTSSSSFVLSKYTVPMNKKELKSRILKRQVVVY